MRLFFDARQTGPVSSAPVQSAVKLLTIGNELQGHLTLLNYTIDD